MEVDGREIDWKWLELPGGLCLVTVFGINLYCVGIGDFKFLVLCSWKTNFNLEVTGYHPVIGNFISPGSTVLGPTQSSIELVPGALPLGVKHPGCEANRPPPTSTEVKNTWICTVLVYRF